MRGADTAWRERTPRQDAAAELADPRTNPEAEAAAAERRERLEVAVRALPVALRQVVTLSLEGFSYKEIADVLGISENNVGVRLNRGKKALRETLGGGR